MLLGLFFLPVRSGYQQVAGVCYGKGGRRVVDIVLVFAQLGCGTAFLSLVLTSLQVRAGTNNGERKRRCSCSDVRSESAE
jgi:amino acid permease